MSNQISRELKEALNRGKAAVAQLRQAQLSESGTFLLGNEDLAGGLTRMEYADGRIAIGKLEASVNCFQLQRWLSADEEAQYRNAHRLPRFIPTQACSSPLEQ